VCQFSVQKVKGQDQGCSQCSGRLCTTKRTAASCRHWAGIFTSFHNQQRQSDVQNSKQKPTEQLSEQRNISFMGADHRVDTGMSSVLSEVGGT